MFGTVPKHNFCDLIYQGKNITDIITWGPMDIGFISGGSGIAGLSNLSQDYLNYIIQNLAKLDAIADIVIIDTGAGISDAVLDFLVASGEILLVATPEPTSITDSYSLLKALNRHPRFLREDSKIKVIANKVSSDTEGETMYNKLNTVVNRYLMQSPRSKSALAYEKMAYALMDKEYDKSLVKRGMAAFFSHIVAGNKKTGQML